MRIAVLAGERIAGEVKQKFLSGDTGLLLAKSDDDFFNSKDVDAYFDLDFTLEPERIEKLSRLLPTPVFINSVVHTLGEIGFPFVRINAWPGFLKRPICELAIQDQSALLGVEKIMNGLGWKYRIVPDIPGMISPRIVAMIINEAYYTVEEQVSSREEVDIAMKLGTNYPYGPFEWSRIIDCKNIFQLLEKLKKSDSRYTISKLLSTEASS